MLGRGWSAALVVIALWSCGRNSPTRCDASTPVCGANARCDDTLGSATCTCLAGYVGDGGVCDLDECLLPGTCHPDAVCTNTPGSFTCACRAGTVGDGQRCLSGRHSSGGWTACEVRADGSLWCWGANRGLTFGVASPLLSGTPVRVGTSSDWEQVSVSPSTTCGIRAGGALWCWGLDGGVAHQLDTSREWRHVSAAARTCAIDDAGDLFCWNPTQQQLGGGTAWRAVSTTQGFACAVARDDTLWCFGANDEGQLGNGTTFASATPVQVTTPSGLRWASVKVGFRNACAIGKGASREFDTAWCWGYGWQGELGSPGSSSTPRQVAGLSGVRELAPGGYHFAAVLYDGTFWSWGSDGMSAARSPPRAQAATGFGGVVAGTQASCAQVDADGGWWCGGNNALGFLRLGSTGTRLTPSVVVQGGFRAVATADSSTCAIRADGALVCMGRWWGGAPPVQTPAQVGVDTDWVTVAMSGGFGDVYGVRGSADGGTLWTWNTTRNPSTLSQVGVDGDWTHVTASRGACGLRHDGLGGHTLWCWTNSAGSLTQVGTATDWVDVQRGDPLSCGVRRAGSLWCWNEGSAPVEVGVGATWRQVAVAGASACARRADDTLWCWGGNQSGQLGLGHTNDVAVPTQVPGLWSLVALDLYGACGVRLDAPAGTSCWGWGDGWQLGTGLLESSFVPVHVTTQAFAQLSHSTFHVLALPPAGQPLWGWGQDPNGVLGTGDAFRTELVPSAF